MAFPDHAAFEEWLEAEHASAPGVYVKLAKKGAGVPSVSYAELVESALCFGWIDGRSNRLDDQFYLQRITPRRSRSVWSQKNVDAVEALLAAGRMRPAGIAAVEAAPAGGRGGRGYAARGGGSGPTPARRRSRFPAAWPPRWTPSRPRGQRSTPWTARTA